MFQRFVTVGALAALLFGVAGLDRPASAQIPEADIHVWWVDLRGDEHFEWGVITPSGEERIWFRAFDGFGAPFEGLYIEFLPEEGTDHFGCDNDPYYENGRWSPPPTDADGYTYLDLKGSGCGDQWVALALNAVGYTFVDIRSPDLNADGIVDLDDFSTFSQLFNGTDPCADYNENGNVELSDFSYFQRHFLDDCGGLTFGSRPELPLAVISPDGPGRGDDASALPGPVVQSSETVVEASLQPNPFRAGTEVRFVLQTPAHAVVDIFDVTGRKLQTLHEGRLGADRHAFRWDGRDSAGQKAAAGVYYARIQAGGDVRTVKGSLIH